MATIQAKTSRGHKYWYIVESRRVNGKPRPVVLAYLGKPLDLLRRLQGLTSPLKVKSYAHGAVAALLKVVAELQVAELINAHVKAQRPYFAEKPLRNRLTAGITLVLAAIGRACAPTSKQGWWQWAKTTSCDFLLRVALSKVDSQHFWDLMDSLPAEAIPDIELELLRRIRQRYELCSDTLAFDTTNFFTFIDSFNSRSKLAQRGKSKEGRSSLRIVGLALLVCGPDQVPLFHRLYAGNHNDPTSFRSVLGELTQRLRLLSHGTHGITLVFDKGNNTDDAIAALSGECHVVGSLVPSHHKELLATRREEMQRLSPERFEREVLCVRTKKEIFGRSYTVLVTWNEALFTAQVTTIEREAAKCALRLVEEEARLERWRCDAIKGGRRPSEAAVRARVAKMLRSRHMKDLFQVTVQPEEEHRGLPRLTWELDAAAFDELKETLLGKTLLFTDNEAWSDEDIVTAYRGQHHVESAFRQMKDTHHVSFRPAHHWTDDKLRVHAFTCVLALTLCSLLRKELAAKGISLSIEAMLESLGSIREVHVMLRSPGPGRPRTQTTHSELAPLAARLFEALDLDSMMPT